MTRKPLREAPLFLLGLILVLELVLQSLDYLVHHVKGTDAGKVSQVMLHAIDAQVVIFGASNTETGISPQTLGALVDGSAYNLALDGTGIEQYSAVLHEYLTYGRKDSLVVLGLSPFALETHVDKAPTASGTYYTHIHNPFIYDVMSQFSSADAWRARYVPFYRYVLYDEPYYKAAARGVLERLPGAASKYAQDERNRGFIPHDTDWGGQHDALNGRTVKCEIDRRVIALHRTIISQINQSGRRVVLVFPPVQAQGRALLDCLPELPPIFASLATAGNHYLDYHRHPMSDDTRYFYNYSHLNAEGAEFFSNLLGKDLAPIVHGERPWTLQ